MTDTAEPTKEDLLKLASEHDASMGHESTPKEPEIDDPEPTEAKPDDNAKAPEAIKDKTKEAAKSGSEASKESAPKTEEKSKSKWVQNEERKNKTWAEINAEKEAIKAQKEALAKERDEVQRRADDIQRAKVTNEPIRDDHGATAKDYRDAAAHLRSQGHTKEADAAEQLAVNLDNKHQQLISQRAQEELKQKWARSFNDLSAKNEGLKDVNSPVYKETIKLLNQFPLLTQQADGLQYAVQMAEFNLKASEFEGTKAELAKLKEDHAKLQKKLSIGGGPPTTALEEEKSFDQLNLKDQRKWLEQAAHSHDRESGFG